MVEMRPGFDGKARVIVGNWRLRLLPVVRQEVAAFSFGGRDAFNSNSIGSGLDVESLVSQLVLLRLAG